MSTGSPRVPRIDRSTPAAVIREFRERWGLTQQQLSDGLGFGKNRLGEYENVGAPAWMRYALVGYATVELKVPAEELGWLSLPARRAAPASARGPRVRTPAGTRS